MMMIMKMMMMLVILVLIDQGMERPGRELENISGEKANIPEETNTLNCQESERSRKEHELNLGESAPGASQKG